jgi:ubiquinone/menaquinone biosynthesis C-methylase UbiE
MSNKEIALEVGCGYSPMIFELRSDLVKEGAALFCADLNIRDLSGIKDIRKSFGTELIPICSDARDLPFENGSVGIVFAKDLVGFPGRWSEFSGFLPPNFTLDELAKECNRVLKPSGRLIILETATPPDIGYIKIIFVKAGFKLLEENRGSNFAYRIFEFGREGKVKASKYAYSLVFGK